MDAHRFDALTRALAAPGSRRRVLRALVGGALAVTALGRRPLVTNAQGLTCNDDPCGGGGYSCCSYPGGAFAGCCLGSCCGTGVDLACCQGAAVCNEVTGRCVAGCGTGEVQCFGTAGFSGCCAGICCADLAGNTTCCSPNAVCSAGACVVPPPPPCPHGLVLTRGCCIVPCRFGTTLNPANCNCERTRTPRCPIGTRSCGVGCCPAGQRCVHGACRPR